MKKFLKIVLIIIAVVLILPNIWSLIVSAVYPMPSGMKKEDVCFLAPGLTWDSTISDVDGCFGKSIEKGDYNDVTGTIDNTYKLEYENHPMTVCATRSALMVTEILCKRRVFRYSFIIECSDQEDAKAVFEKLCDELVDSEKLNERFEHEKYGEGVFSATIGYGPTDIYYDIEKYVNDVGENEVRLTAYAHY